MMYDIEKAKRIGERIEETRKDRKLTQERLGELCGFTKFKLSKLENDTQLPAIDEVLIIANALNVDIEYLLGLEKKPTEPLINNFEKIMMAKTYTAKVRAVYEEKHFRFLIDEDYFVLSCKEKVISLFKELASLQADKKGLTKDEYKNRIVVAKQNFAKGKNSRAEPLYLLTDSQLNKLLAKATTDKNYLKTLLESLNDDEE